MSTERARSNRHLGAHMEAELSSQPDIWERTAVQATGEAPGILPQHGQKIAVIGCGTSWFMSQSYAALREGSGKGTTDAFAASEANLLRDYDAVLVISRSGTTTEIVDTLRQLRGKIATAALLGDERSPAAKLADSVAALPYADEQSVVQTRFATSALIYLQTALGYDLSSAVADARSAIAEPVDFAVVETEQVSFLGRGWTVGLAHEAALRCARTLSRGPSHIRRWSTGMGQLQSPPQAGSHGSSAKRLRASSEMLSRPAHGTFTARRPTRWQSSSGHRRRRLPAPGAWTPTYPGT